MSKHNDPRQAKDTRELIKIAVDLGYQERKTGGGSHRILTAQGMPTLSIPNSHDLAPGTRRNLAKLILGDSYYEKN